MATRIIQTPNAFPKKAEKGLRPQPRVRGKFQAFGLKKCKRCNGRALSPGYICPSCNGQGYLARVRKSSPARFNSRLRKTSLKKVSDSLRAKLELYKELRPEFLKGKNCEYPKEPFGCLNPASQIHHRKGRGKYLLDRRTWLAVCGLCHHYLETHKKEARKLGIITYK